MVRATDFVKDDPKLLSWPRQMRIRQTNLSYSGGLTGLTDSVFAVVFRKGYDLGL
jgi:hypothetical protein